MGGALGPIQYIHTIISSTEMRLCGVQGEQHAAGADSAAASAHPGQSRLSNRTPSQVENNHSGAVPPLLVAPAPLCWRLRLPRHTNKKSKKYFFIFNLL